MHQLDYSAKAPPAPTVPTAAPAAPTPPQPVESPQPPVDQPPEPQKSRRRWVWWLAGGIAIASLGLGIWYWQFRAQPLLSIPFSGRIEGYETDVSTKGAGRIETVSVREGDTVTKGQVLVRLSDDGVQAELKAATSQVEAAKQREAAARLQISVIESQADDAALNLQQTEGDTDGKVAEAEGLVATAQAFFQQEQARVGEATALIEQTKADSDRYATLVAQGAETQQRYEVARTSYNTAQAALLSREAAVEEARNAIAIAQGKLTQARTTTLNPDRQETSISGLQGKLGQAKVALLAASADVKTAIANQQLIQSRLNDLTVKSPITGVVTTRSVEPGTVVLPSRPLLRIVDLDQVYLRGFIPGDQISEVRVGQSAKIYLDNDLEHEHPLNATIAAVDSTASFTPENIYFQKDRVEQVFGVKLTIDKPSGLAKPGMPADAEIPL